MVGKQRRGGVGGKERRGKRERERVSRVGERERERVEEERERNSDRQIHIQTDRETDRDSSQERVTFPI